MDKSCKNWSINQHVSNQWQGYLTNLREISAGESLAWTEPVKFKFEQETLNARKTSILLLTGILKGQKVESRIELEGYKMAPYVFKILLENDTKKNKFVISGLWFSYKL